MGKLRVFAVLLPSFCRVFAVIDGERVVGRLQGNGGEVAGKWRGNGGEVAGKFCNKLLCRDL